MARGRQYSAAELEHAIRLKASGLTWSTIAERLQRSEKALQITASRYRRGLWSAWPRGSSLAITAKVEDLVSSGVTTIHGVAQVLGVSDPAACRRLMRMGLDAEMRRAVAAEHSPSTGA